MRMLLFEACSIIVVDLLFPVGLPPPVLGFVAIQFAGTDTAAEDPWTPGRAVPNRINTFKSKADKATQELFSSNAVLRTVAAMASKSLKMRPEFQNLGPPLVGEKFFGCWGCGFYCARYGMGYSRCLYAQGH